MAGSEQLRQVVAVARHTVRRVPWARLGLLLGVWVIGVLLIVQLFYPGDKLLPLQQVDGYPVGAMSKQAAIQALSTAYANTQVRVYLGSAQNAAASPTFSQAGLSVNVAARVSAMQYPWYERLVPSSILWGTSASGTPKIASSHKTDEFLTTQLLPQCQVAPQNATLKANGDKLVVVPAQNGGECSKATVKQDFLAFTPSLGRPVAAQVSMTTVPPKLINAAAQASADYYMKQVGNGITLVAGGQPIVIPASEVYSWLDFTPTNVTVQAHINGDRAAAYLNKVVAPKVAVAPGTATVTMRDFTEQSRVGGGDGTALNLDATTASIEKVVHGDSNTASAATQPVPANVTYVHTYTSTDQGVTALFANFAKDHPGTFGISYAELSGSGRHANYQGDKKFVTASTYKLFVAYSVLKRVDSGEMSWADNEACFNKMITYSDNACGEAFLNTIGLQTITNEINALGLKNSNFIEDGGPYTTANDLALFLGTLESGTMFSATSKQRLESAMLANVYRNGIPAGTSAPVADKVGFLNGLLHDAAIVYSPKGTYVLVVMSDGSSWGAIADLTRQLEAIR